MSSTKKKIKYCSYCAVLPTNENPLPDDLFDLDETSIVYPSEEFDSVNRWDFDGVFNGPKDFLGSYKNCIAPLVQSVERGENAMLIFGGVPFMDPLDYLASRQGRTGFISMAADQLIKSTIHGRQKMAAVTLSWFKVECSSSEAITDLLRVASTPNNPKGPDPNLVLREVGRGKGMFVSGLWEVELAAGSDVESVIAHVSKLVPGSAHIGSSHSVFQLTLTPVKQGGNNSSSQLMLEENGPSRLTFVQLSSLAPSAPPTADQHVSGNTLPVFPWVDHLSDLLVWMNSRRPSPPFHKSRIMLLLRDAICGRMPGAMYFLMQPIVPAVSDNCLWLQLCFRIRDLITRRANVQPSQGTPSVQSGQIQSTPASKTESRSPTVSDAPPISSQMMYPAVTSPAHNQSGLMTHLDGNQRHVGSHVDEQDFNEEHLVHDRSCVQEEEELSFENIKRMSADISKKYAVSHGPSRDKIEQGGNNIYPNRTLNYGDDFINETDCYFNNKFSSSEEEPFQYMPSPPPPAPPSIAPEPSSGSYVNPFDELLATRGVKPIHFTGPSRRRTASDVSGMVYEAIQEQDRLRTAAAAPRADVHDVNAYSRRNSATPATSARVISQPIDSMQTASNPSNPGPAAAQRTQRPVDVAPADRGTIDPSPSEVYINRRELRNMPSSSKDETDKDANIYMLHGLEPSDLEALLEALHRSRQENKNLTESVAQAEERCTKLTREYERLVGKVQEEGYFLRNKEREKLKKVMQDLQDYEVYKQVMETAMSKMQIELDLLVKENKVIKEENVSHERVIRKLKTEGFKTQKVQEDLQRDAAGKCDVIQELQDKLAARTKERDSAIESLSHFKLKYSKHESEMSTKIKSQDVDIKELMMRLDEMSSKFLACETARIALEESSKQEIEKFRTAHLAALDKCMGYQEENDLLRASLSDIIEAQEESLMNEEQERGKRA